MKTILNALVLILAILLTSCNGHGNKQAMNETNKSSAEIQYAKGFTLEHHSGYIEIKVRNPWDSSQYLNKYILVDRNRELPKNLPEGTLVRTPVERVAFCSSVHAGMWNMLWKVSKIVAVCEPEYINLPEVQAGLKNGKVLDLGMATAINIEKLIVAKPELLVVSPFENTSTDRYTNAGIAVAQDASYMEESPLGRSEWIKFEAAFAGESTKADSIFEAIERRYNSLKAKVAKTKVRPTVFTEKKFGDAWYVSGGNSYVGQFLKDAGSNYLWNDLVNKGSVPLPFEKVYAKAINADFWLLKYNNAQTDLTYNQLQTEYDLYANFKAFKNKNIFAMNSAKCPFYEQGPMEPDVVLADIVSIFHPELLPGYQPKYYFRIK